MRKPIPYTNPENLLDMMASIRLPLEIEKVHPDVLLPRYGSQEAAGLDLSAWFDADFRRRYPERCEQQFETDGHPGLRFKFLLYPRERIMISTGVKMAITPGWAGTIFARSGHASKHGIDVLGRLVDSDYRGEVKCILLNTGHEAFPIWQGYEDRPFAQIKFSLSPQACITTVPCLDYTERGERGLGENPSQKVIAEDDDNKAWNLSAKREDGHAPT